MVDLEVMTMKEYSTFPKVSTSDFGCNQCIIQSQLNLEFFMLDILIVAINWSDI